MSAQPPPYAGERPLERRAAHAHRLLLAFLQVAEAAAEIDGAVHPLERGALEGVAAGPNRYRRAVVVVRSLDGMRAGWEQLERVVSEARAAGVPPRSLVLPVVREGVRGVRVRSRVAAVGRELRASAVRGQAERELDRDLALLARLGGEAGGREQALAARIAQTERVLASIAQSEALVVRWPVKRHAATLYFEARGRAAERLHVPKPGVVVAGTAVTFEVGQELRQARSDRVTLEPLCRWGAREVFDAAAYRAAVAALRGEGAEDES